MFWHFWNRLFFLSSYIFLLYHLQKFSKLQFNLAFVALYWNREDLVKLIFHSIPFTVKNKSYFTVQQLILIILLENVRDCTHTYFPWTSILARTSIYYSCWIWSKKWIFKEHSSKYGIKYQDSVFLEEQHFYLYRKNRRENIW